MKKTYRRLHTPEELQRAMDADRERSEAEAKVEEERQAKARRDFADAAAKVRRCSCRANPS